MHFVGYITSKLHRRCLITKRRGPVCIDSAVKYQTGFGAFNCTIDTGKISSRYCNHGDAFYLRYDPQNV